VLLDGTAPGAALPAERLQDLARAYNKARGWGLGGWVIVDLGLTDLSSGEE
jgi:hypothetical protein